MFPLLTSTWYFKHFETSCSDEGTISSHCGFTLYFLHSTKVQQLCFEFFLNNKKKGSYS